MPRLVSIAFLATLLLPMGEAISASPSQERKALLLHRLKHDCGSCHGMTMKGGLGPSLRPAALAGKSDDALADIIIRGLPGTPMPPWAFEINRSEALWLVQWLRGGEKNER